MPPAGGLQQQRGLVGPSPGGTESSGGALPAFRRLLPGLLWLLLVALVYADPLFVARNFAGRDLLGYHLPVEKAVHDAYARRSWPVWFAEISGGRPLLPNINVGALYPIRPLLAPFRFPVAMRIYPVLHWAVAGLGVMALLRVLGVSRSAAAVGAVTYVFSGVGVSESFYTNTHPGVALLPWIVWSVARPAVSWAGRVLTASVLIGLELLAGDVFTTSLSLVAAVIWILVEKTRASRAAELSALGAAALFSALLALPQLVATLLWIPETHRAVSGMTAGEALRFSVQPWRLLEFIVPYPFGPTWSDTPRATWAPRAFGGLATGFFVTLYAGSFALVAAIVQWRRKEGGVRFARALAILALGACVLPSFVPRNWHTWAAPLPLRYPEKMAVGAALSAAVFAGIALDGLRRENRRRHWLTVVGVSLTVLAALAALFPQAAARLAVQLLGSDRTLIPAAAVHLPAALAEGGLLWMASAVALGLLGRGGRLSHAVAVFLIALCPIAADRRIARSFREEEIFAPTAFARAMTRRDAAGSFRALGESRYIPSSPSEGAQLSSDVGFLDYRRRSWLVYTPALWGRGTVFNDDFDAGDLSRAESLRRLSFRSTAFHDPGAFFASVSLRFGIRFPDQQPPPGFRPFGGTGFEAWDENARALPDVRLLGRWREATDAVDALRQIPIGSEVTLETGRTSLGSAREGSLRVLEKTPEVLRAEVDVTEPTYLFVLRGYWSYHSVSVDGHPVSVIPAQLAFSAVAVPIGRHRIEWRETIPGIEGSRWGPALYGIVAIALLLKPRRPKEAR